MTGDFSPENLGGVQKVLLVTGGSRGIGAAVAELAAQEGYAVAVNFKEREASALEVVKRIRSAGGTAIPVRGDVSNQEEVRAMFREVDVQLGKVTALVNNAGILEEQTRVESLDPQRLQRIFAVNVFGAIYCAQEAIRRMSTKHGGNGGAIVNVGSVASRLGAASEYVDYAASKGALDSFTVGLANELAQEGIRVNGVRPGFIYTEIHASGGEPGRVDRVSGSVPMRRGGRPEEVAKAILWLLGDGASFTTGSFVEVAGGR